MREITGNLWDYYNKRGFAICITTNGALRKDGCGVMGRGCALEAKQRIPGIEKLLGEGITKWGNVFRFAVECVAFFPTKHHWMDKADLVLIQKSAEMLAMTAKASPDCNFILPRPGCGNGGLRWEEVKPVIEFLPDNVWVICP
jgi:hypothetical protein